MENLTRLDGEPEEVRTRAGHGLVYENCRERLSMVKTFDVFNELLEENICPAVKNLGAYVTKEAYAPSCNVHSDTYTCRCEIPLGMYASLMEYLLLRISQRCVYVPLWFH